MLGLGSGVLGSERLGTRELGSEGLGSEVLGSVDFMWGTTMHRGTRTTILAPPSDRNHYCFDLD